MDDKKATLYDVCGAYRVFLEREPDTDGLVSYANMLAGGMTLAELRGTFLGSAEYLKKRAARVLQIEIGEQLFAVVDVEEPDFGRAIHRNKTWEPHIVRLITSSLIPGYTFVDVGANVGVMSFHAARTVGPSGKVIAFEPNPENANCFLQGVAANSFQNVMLVPVALSDSFAVLPLSGDSNSHLLRSTSGGQRERLVQAAPGDLFLAGEESIHFLKIDIEGFEPFALKGLARTLARHRPRLLCEFNPRCLKDHAGAAPDQFAGEIFHMTTVASAIEHDGKTNTVKDASSLMNLWADKNKEAVASGRLPDGMLHFDLMFTPDRLA